MLEVGEIGLKKAGNCLPGPNCYYFSSFIINLTIVLELLLQILGQFLDGNRTLNFQLHDLFFKINSTISSTLASLVDLQSLM